MALRTTPAPPGTALRAPGATASGDRPDALWDMERALRRRGFAAVAGADEAGRGACAGPLVAAACVLPAGRRGRVPGLADSKLLTAAARERVYEEVVQRAQAWSVVVLPVADLDARGMHVTNIEALRRAVWGLDPGADYVLTDGFPVPGLARPALAVWKGDRVAACVAAASVLAKVTRDRIMLDLHERWPQYDFAVHKGYSTAAHDAALRRHGPCPAHRARFVNVARARAAHAGRGLQLTGSAAMVDDGAMPPVSGEPR
ncbi:ribonuclease HII [Geodermatophilus sp. DSM 44513]|uniref:ribonuclease HII n=1 Tax=Geodermatophilus sp. DSM 44513 TaxID=1528104 RepID=UPI00128853C9|nr:ribonuclease HII [Geodermatophilus sp. DSM 44513]WNV74463.1 ribonuclease HII [Geodermatophilus sp. DSM 44513]